MNVWDNATIYHHKSVKNVNRSKKQKAKKICPFVEDLL